MIEETKQIEKKSILIIFLLLSILIHILLLLLLFKYQYQIEIANKQKENLIEHKKIEALGQDEKKIQKEKEFQDSSMSLPDIKEKKGIPIFFIDEEELNKSKKDYEEMQETIEQQDPSKSASKIESELPQSNIKEEKAQINKEELNQSSGSTIINEQEQFIDSNLKSDSTNHISSEDTISSTKHVKKPRRKILSHENRPILPKNVMQGILDGFDDGEHLFTYISNNNNNLADLKFVGYIDRILANIHNSWNITKHKIKIRKAMLVHFGMALVLDKDGKIISLVKTRSTGILELDDIVMETIRYAAPYPPIPKHFNKEHFNYNATFYVEIK